MFITKRTLKRMKAEIKAEISREIEKKVAQDFIKVIAIAFAEVFVNNDGEWSEHTRRSYSNRHFCLRDLSSTQLVNRVKKVTIDCATSLARILDKKIRERYDERMSELVTAATQEEQFIDWIIERVNRKQLNKRGD